MTGKYSSELSYQSARIHRNLLRARLSPLAQWTPLEDAKSGYSILIGCNAPLAEMLGANLQMLSRQDLSNIHEILVVFDRPAAQLSFPVEQVMRERFPALPLHFLFYSEAEERFFEKLGLPYGFCWFSWQKAIEACQTRYAILHDFDAMLLRPNIIEERYRTVVENNADWCGTTYYSTNGIEPEMELLTTFEMMLNAEFVRRTFQPIDAFNRVGKYQGRNVDFDIFLHSQTVAGKKLLLPIAEQDMVHPSQVIHQFTELTHRRQYIPPEENNILFIPYFLYLAGNESLLLQTLDALRTASGKTLPFFGRTLNLQKLSAVHVAWIRKQITRLEQAVAGSIRPEIEQYMSAIESIQQAHV